MTTIDPNYRPLLLALDPSHAEWSARDMALLGSAMKAWDWADPIRRKKLPALLHCTGDYPSAQVLLSWANDLGMADPDPKDPEKVLGPKLGTTSTPLNGVGKVIVTFSRKLYTEVDFSNWSRVFQHELGHALGLVHDHGGIMHPHIDTTPAFVSQGNREAAAKLRRQGVVGVRTAEGN
jgi:hypothetical protein